MRTIKRSLLCIALLSFAAAPVPAQFHSAGVFIAGPQRAVVGESLSVTQTFLNLDDFLDTHAVTHASLEIEYPAGTVTTTNLIASGTVVTLASYPPGGVTTTFPMAGTAVDVPPFWYLQVAHTFTVGDAADRLVIYGTMEGFDYHNANGGFPELLFGRVGHVVAIPPTLQLGVTNGQSFVSFVQPAQRGVELQTSADMVYWELAEAFPPLNTERRARTYAANDQQRYFRLCVLPAEGGGAQARAARPEITHPQFGNGVWATH